MAAGVLHRVTNHAAHLGSSENFNPERYAKVTSKIAASIEGRQSDEFGAALQSIGSSYDEQIAILETAMSQSICFAASVNSDNAARRWFESARMLRAAAIQLTTLKGTDAQLEQQMFETRRTAEAEDREAHIDGTAAQVETEIRRIVGNILPDGSQRI